MDLWIRSQNRKILVKCDTLSLTQSELSIISFGTNKVLGTYKTKKRALEVLDEIQKFIQPLFNCTGYEVEKEYGFSQTIKLYFNESNIFNKKVYNMPKK